MFIHIQDYSSKMGMTLPLLSLVFLAQLVTTPATAQATTPQHPYTPIENIALACGRSTSSRNESGRQWLPDLTTSKLFTLIEPSTTNKSTPCEATQPPRGQSEVPYLTARVSHSQFTYSFPVSPGQKFIRLHFYPTATYPGFQAYPAWFSVSAGNFTFLNNFTGQPWIQDLESGSGVYVKEFVLNVGDDDKLLNVTFTPSSVITDAYAFVNGIELVSMPTGLYYPDEELYLVNSGVGSSYPISNGTALELMYRINVGGTQVPPEDDTGMFRNWESEQDYADNTLFSGATPLDIDYTVTLKFTNNAKNYTAPEKVYRTAQMMGNNKTNSLRNNLTWRFPVDSGFTYLVRLHFCQLVLQYNKTNAQDFSIYVATYLAEDKADLSYWAGGGGVGVPMYKDYPVGMWGLPGASETTKLNLSIELHPNVRQTVYDDAILNGVEILKASNDGGDLAGTQFYSPPPPPPPPSTTTSTSDSSSSGNGSKFGIIGGVVAGAIAVAVLVFLALLLFRRKRKLAKVNGKYATTSSDGATSWWDSFTTVAASTTKSTKSQKATLPSGLCRYFSLAEIKAATNNFDDVFIIGVGGFGDVYKGFISSVSAEVAIKRLKQGSEQGANEFKTEIEMLSQLRHVHLVSLIGYCNEDDEMILVYDYMSRGTLREHLYNTDNPPLSWAQRLEICIGSARGLHYLHSGAKYSVIHRDVKTTNILLDEKWIAKVSDFGLSKIGPNSNTKAHISTVVKGSIGYLDPEYYRRQQLTEKSDVYSFGVVLCEVLCARPPVNRSMVKRPVSLAEWFRQSYRNHKLVEIVDPNLNGKIAPECLRKYAEVAVRCLADSGVDRPSMSDVVWGLEFALQLQVTAKEKILKMKSSNKGSYGVEYDQADVESIDMESPFRYGGSSTADDNEDLFSVSSGIVVDSRLDGFASGTNISSGTNTSSEERSLLSVPSSEVLNSGTVFSEILHPNGR